MSTASQELNKVEARKPYPPTASLEKGGKASKHGKRHDAALEDDRSRHISPPPPYESPEFRQEGRRDVPDLSSGRQCHHRTSFRGPLPALTKHDDSKHDLKHDLRQFRHDMKQFKQELKRDLTYDMKQRHHHGHHHHHHFRHHSSETDEHPRGRQRGRGRKERRNSSTSSSSSGSSSSSSSSGSSHEGARRLKQNFKQFAQRLRGKV